MEGWDQVIPALGKRFGWRHNSWGAAPAEELKLPAMSPSKQTAGTIRWLITAVGPALRRLESEGQVEDIRAWIDEYLLTEPEAASESKFDGGTDPAWLIQ